jgi:hypothetical protein
VAAVLCLLECARQELDGQDLAKGPAHDQGYSAFVGSKQESVEDVRVDSETEVKRTVLLFALKQRNQSDGQGDLACFA